MSLIQLLINVQTLSNALDAQTHQLARIADALEHAFPAPPDLAPNPRPVAEEDKPPIGFSFAETPDQYAIRMAEEQAFANSLGFSSYSPQLQQMLREMRADLMHPSREIDETGNEVPVEGKSVEEANEIIKQAFSLAQVTAANAALAGEDGNR